MVFEVNSGAARRRARRCGRFGWWLPLWLLVTPVAAQTTTTWSNAGGDGLWNNAANWIGGLPISGDTTGLFFTNPNPISTSLTLTQNLGNPLILNSLSIVTSTTNVLTIQGSPLQFAGSGSILQLTSTAATAVSTVTIAAPITIGGSSLTFKSTGNTAALTVTGGVSTTNSGATTLVLDGTSTHVNNRVAGIISDGPGGALGIYKTGIGVWTLTNSANSFSGGVTVAQGTLRFGSPGSLGAASGTIQLGEGSGISTTLAFAGGSAATLTHGLALSGTGVFTIYSTTVSLTVAGPISFRDADAKILALSGNTSDTNVLASMLTDNGAAPVGLQKSGAPTWIITNSNNSFSGGVSITLGELRVTDMAAQLNMAQNNLRFTATTGAVGVLETAGSITNALGSGANQIRFGTGGATLNSGGFAAVGGDLDVTLNNDAATPILWGGSAGTTNLSLSTELQFNSSHADGVVNFHNALTLGSGTHRVLVVDNVTGGTVDRAVLSGTISGSGGLYKYGSGVLALSGNNSFTGGITLNAGMLRAADLASNLNLRPGGGYLRFTGTSNGTAGVLETSGTLTNSIGTAAGEISWNSSFSGGFAAVGGSLDVTLNNHLETPLVWASTTGFLSGVGELVLGSANADAVVSFNNSIDLNGVTRTVRVLDNTTVRTDYAVLAGAISNGGLVKQGTGLLEIAGNNTFTGGISIAGGVVRVNSTAANLGDSPIRFNASSANGAILETSGTLTSALGAAAGQVMWGPLGAINPTTAAGGGFSAYGGALDVTLNGDATTPLIWNSTNGFVGTGGELQFGSLYSDNVVTLNNSIDLNDAVRTIRVNDNPDGTADYAVLTGVLSSASLSGGLIKQGAGTLVLAGDSTFTGTTTVVGGTLRVGNGGTNGSLVGAVRITNSTAQIMFDRSDVLDVPSVIGGTGSVTITGPTVGTGGVTFNAANTYIGLTTVENAVVRYGVNNALPVSTALILNATATLDLNGFNGGVTTLSDGGLGGGVITNKGAATALLTLTQGNFSGRLADGAGALAITKLGAGTLTLGGVGYFSGGLTLGGTGTLFVADAGSLGTGPLTFSGGKLQSAGALTITNPVNFNGAVTLGGDAPLTISSGMPLNVLTASTLTNASTLGAAGVVINDDVFLAANLTLTGGNDVTLNGNLGLVGSDSTLTLTVANAGGHVFHDVNLAASGSANTLALRATTPVTIDGTISDGGLGGGLTLVTGTVTFGAANTYVGGTTLVGGRAVLAANGAFGTGPVFVGGAITVESAAGVTRTLVNNFTLSNNLTLAGESALVLGGDITPTLGNRTLTFTGGGDKILSGNLILGDAATARTLTISGAAGGGIVRITGTIQDGPVAGGALAFTLTNRVVELSGVSQYTGRTTIAAGAVRLNNDFADAFGSAPAVFAGLSAVQAVIESSGLLTPNVGTSAGQISWAGGLSGGFAAYGGPLSVTLNNDAATPLVWNSTAGFLTTGELQLGSISADDTVTLNNTIDFNNGTRTIRVFDGAADVDAVIAGDLFGTTTTTGGSLNKQGPGKLVLTGSNAYKGATTVAAGTLQIGDGGLVGQLNPTTAVNVAAGAALIFDRTGSLSQTTISGAGGVTISVTGGTLTVTNFNPTGLSTLHSGTLQVGNGRFAAFNAANVVVDGGAVLKLSTTSSLTTSANLSGGGALIVSNTAGAAGAIVTYRGNSTLSGGTTLTGAFATLRLGDGVTAGAGNLAGDVAITGTGGTLIFNRPDDATFAGSITGNGQVRQQGGGVLTLAGNNSYSGATSVAAGTLNVTGTLGNTAVTVAAGATLGGSGIVGGGVTSLGTLSPGVSGTGTLTVGSLVLGGGALNFDLDAVGASDQIMLTGTAAPTVNAATTFNFSNLTGFAAGTYTLLSGYAGQLTSTGFGLLSYTTSLGGFGLSLQNNAGALDLLVSSLPPSNILVWIGATDGIWNTTSANWSGSFETFTDGRDVVFDNTAMTTSVAVVGTVQPASVLVNNDAAHTYTLGGGVIAGAGGLTKQGGGTLVLAGGNAYTGTTYVAAGTLQITGTGAFGSSHLVLDPSARPTVKFAPAGTLDVGGAIGGDGNLDFITGTTVLSGSNTFGGFWNLYGGATLKLAGGDDRMTNDPWFVMYAGATAAVLDLNGVNQKVGIFGSSGTGAEAGLITNNAAGTTSVLTIGLGDVAAAIQDGAGAVGLRVDGGPFTITLKNDNSYTGGTTIQSGKLQLGDGGNKGSLVGDVANNGTLIFKRSDAYTFNGAISGTGSVVQSGTGSVTLAGVNSYTGVTSVSAGTLNVTGTLGNTAVTVAAGATLGGTGVLGGSVTSLGTLSPGVSGVGTLTVGSLILSGGAINFELGSVGASDQIVLTGTAAPAVNASTALNFSALGGYGLGTYTLISGYTGQLTSTGFGLLSYTSSLGGFGLSLQNNSGALDLLVSNIAGSNTLVWTGATDGAWNTSSANWSGAATTFTNGRDVVFDNTALTTSVVISGSVQPASVLVNNDAAHTYTLGGGTLAGTGGLTKQGDGTLVLTYTNTYSGGTTISGGTLQIGNGSTLGSLTGTVHNDSHLVVNRGGTLILSGVISGSGDLANTGTGTLILAADNTYTGLTTVTSGTLQIGNGGTVGSIKGDIVNNAAVTFNHSDTLTFSGAISGSGSITKIGAGTLVLTGTNSFTGGISITGGVVRAANPAQQLNLASNQVRLADTVGTGGGVLETAGSLTTGLGTNPGEISFVRSGGFAAFGGDLDITLNNDPSTTLIWGSTPGFVSSSNELVFGSVNSDAITTLRNNLDVNNNVINGTRTVRIIDNPNSVNDRTVFSGTFAAQTVPNFSGYWIKAGDGTLVLTGNTTELVTVYVSQGTLQLGDGGTSGQMRSINVWGNGTVVVNRTDDFTLPGQLSGSGMLVKNYNNTFAVNPGGFTGTAVINSGAFRATGGYGAAMTNLTSSNSLLMLGSSSTWSVTSQITGAGGLLKVANGTVIYSGTADYTGGTTISAGVFQIGSGGTAGSITGDILNNASLVVNRANTITLAGAISGTGSLENVGNGTLILTGDNSYTGGTTVTAGTLQIGNGGASGILSGNIVDNAALVVNRSGTWTFADIISGSGSLHNIGTGTLILAGNNTYAGTTTVAAGTLQIGVGGASGSIAGNIVNNAALVFNHSDTVTYGGNVSGVGALQKAGSGTLVLTGTNLYSGTTTIEAGTLTVQAGKLGSTTSNIYVGTASNATALNVVSGAVVTSSRGFLGLNAVGSAAVIADTGSQWNVSDSLFVGGNAQTAVGSASLTVTGGAVVNAGGGTTIYNTGTINIGNGGLLSTRSLILDGGSLNFTLGTISASAFINLTGTTAPSIIAASHLDFAAAAGFGSGLYHLIGGYSGNISSTDYGRLSLPASFAGFALSLQNNSGALDLLVTALSTTNSVSWVGGVNNDWNSTAANWTGDLTVFSDYGSAVTFDNSSATTTVAVDPVGVHPSRMTVNNDVAHPYYFSGGAITSSGTLTKFGAGTFIFANDASFTAFGGANVAEGVMQIGDGGSVGSFHGNISGGGAVVFNRADTVTYDDIIFSASSVTQVGSGTLVLTNNGNLFDKMVISSGTLQLGNGGTSGRLFGFATVTNNGVLAFNRSDSNFFDNVISGTGGVVQAGTGTTILTGENTYTGLTTVNAGTLQIGFGGSGSIVGDVRNYGVVAFNRFFDPYQYGGVISGTGSVIQNGANTLIFAADNTYTGITTIGVSGTLQLGNGGEAGSVAGNIFNSGTLVVNRSNAFQMSGTIGGVGSIVINSGNLTLTGINTSGGTTTISGGSLLVQNGTFGTTAGNLYISTAGENGGLNVIASGTVNRNAVYLGNSVDSYGMVLVDAGEMKIVNDLFVGKSGTSGFQTQQGGSVSVNRTYLGFDPGANGSVTIDGSGSRWTLTNLLDIGYQGTGNLVVTNSASLTSSSLYLGHLSGGAGKATVDGVGSQVLVSNHLTIGYTGTGEIFVQNGAQLVSGTGHLAWSTVGSGTATISGTGSNWTVTNYLYVGDYAAGTLNVMNGAVVTSGTGDIAFGSLSSGNVVITGTGSQWNITNQLLIGGSSSTAAGQGSLTVTNGGVVSVSGLVKIWNTGSVSIGEGSTLSAGIISGGGGIINDGALIIGNATSTTYSGTISGRGSLTKVGTDTLTLTANNSYTGGTTIAAGTLQIGTGSTSGSIVGDVVMTGGKLAFNRSELQTFNGAISGSGGLLQLGAGTTVLTGSNTFTGGITITNGALRAADVNANLNLANNNLRFAGTSTSSAVLETSGTLTNSLGTGAGQITWSNLSYGGFAAVGGNLDVVLNDDATTPLVWGSGGFVSASGALVLGSVNADAVTTFRNNIDLANGVRTIKVVDNPNSTDDVAVLGGVLSSSSLTGALVKTGSGTLILTGDNSYTGYTTVSQGTLQLGNGGTTGNVSGTITVSTGATLVFRRSDDVVLNSPVNVFGTFVKEGGNTVTGTSFFWNGTVEVNDGVLAAQGIYNPGLTKLNAPSAVFAFNAAPSSTYQFGFATSGIGMLLKQGTGTMAVTGALTHLGGTTISEGTLKIHGTSGSIVGDVANFGTLMFSRSNTLTFSGSISGTGQVRQTGTGLLVFDGNNTYSGNTSLTSGTLNVSGTVANSAVTVASGATLDGAGYLGNSATVLSGGTLSGQLSIAGAVTSSGSINPGGSGFGTLTVGSLVLNGGSLNFGLGSILASDQIAVTGFAAPIVNQATNLNFTNLGGFGVGTYRLISGYSGLLTTTDFGRLSWTGVLNGLGLSLQNNAGSLDLIVSNLTGTNLNWSGAVNGNWDTTTANWSGDATTFNNGVHQVTFDNSSSVTSVTVTAGVSPLQMTVNNDAAHNYLFTGGSITSNGALVKQGVGTLTFANMAQFSGGATIMGGVLQIGDGGTTGTFSGDIRNSGTVVFNHSIHTTYYDVISGSGDVRMAGTGTIEMTGANTYAGATSVASGTMLIGGSLGNTPVTVAGGATFGGSGAVGGSVAVQAGGTLQGSLSVAGAVTSSGSISPGSGGVGSLGVGSLLLYGGSLYYELGSVAASDQIVVSGTAAPSIFGTVNLSFSNVAGFGPGLYHLITGYSGLLSTTSFDLLAAPPSLAGYDLTLQNNSGALDLLVGSLSGTVTALWTGGGANGSWSNAANWGGTLPASGPTTSVLFDAATGTTTFNQDLSTPFTLNSLQFVRRAGATYTLSGGDLAFSGANALILYNGTGVSSSSITQTIGTNILIAGDNLSIVTTSTNYNAVRITGNITTTNVGATTLTLGGTSTSTNNVVAGSITDGSGTLGLIKADTGLWILSGTNAFTGGLTVKSGTLRFTSAASTGVGPTITLGDGSTSGTVSLSVANAPVSLTQSIRLAGITNTAGASIFNDASSAASSVTLLGAVQITNTGNKSLTLGGINTGANVVSGTLSNGGSAQLGLIKAGAGTWVITNTANSFTGGVTILAGILRAPDLAALNTASNAIVMAGTSLTNSGVLETAGSLTLDVGTGAGRVRWAGGGGFSAFGGNLDVTLNGDAATPLVWNGTSGFITGTYNLLLSSTSADGIVNVRNAIDFAGVARTVRVVDNPALTTDYAVLSGTLSNGSLDKQGAGTLVLTASNSLSGTSTLGGGGTLVLGNDRALGTSKLRISTSGTLMTDVARTIDNPILLGGNLIVGGTQSLTLTGLITLNSGSRTLSTSNTGVVTLNNVDLSDLSATVRTLTLAGNGAFVVQGAMTNGSGTGNLAIAMSSTSRVVMNGMNSYTGPTTVTGGTLIVNGSSSSSLIAVATPTAGLGGNGVLAGIVTSTGAISPGDNGTGTLTVGALILNGGSLNFELAEVLASDRIVISGGTAPTVNAMTSLNFSAVTGFGAGTYQLISGYSGLLSSTDFGRLSYASYLNGYTLQLLNGAGSLDLLVGSVSSTNLVWTGAADGVWNTTSANWSGTSSFYAEGQDVQFGNLTGVTTITVDAAGVNPASMTVDSDAAHHYLFTGGAITSSGALTKDGAGSLVLADDVAFAGGANVIAGKLQIGNGGETGSYSGDIVNNGQVVFNRSNMLVYSGDVSGTGGITQTGAGTTVLTGSNSFTGGVTLAAGSLRAADLQTNLNLANNNLRFSGTAGATPVLETAGTFTAGVGTESGQVRWTGAGGFAAVGGALDVTLNGDSSTPFAWGTADYPSANKELVFGSVNSDAVTTFRNNLSFVSGTGAIRVVDNPNSTSDVTILSGNVVVSSSAQYFTKTGDGTLVFTGTSSDFVGVTVSQGTFQLGNGGVGGIVSAVTLSGGTLALNRSVASGFTGVLSGTGSVIKNLTNTFTEGNISYHGSMIVNDGAVVATGFYSPETTVLVADSSRLIFAPATTTWTTTASTNISGSGALVSAGSGTVIFTGNAVHSGGTTVSSGLFSVGAGGTAGSISGSIQLSGSGKLQFNRSDDVTISGSIGGGGSGSVIKAGGNTLTLAGASTYTSATSVAAGVLRVVGSLGNTPITVGTGAQLQIAAGASTGTGTIQINSGASLQSEGASGGTVVLGNGGSLFPGLGGIATMTVGGLTLGGGNLYFQFASPGVNDQIVLTGGSAPIISSPTSLNVLDVGGFGVGTYTLFSGYGSNFIAGIDLANLSLNSVAGFNLSLDNSQAGRLDLIVALSGAQSLVWTGSASSSWNATDVNWTNGGSPIAYDAGDAVLFDDAGGGGEIEIGAAVAPDAVVFAHTTAVTYTLTGAAISGTGGLTKNGDGLIVLANDNTYSGITQVNAGTLQIGGGGTSGSISSSSLIFNNGVVAFNRSDDSAYNGVISGTGSVVKNGTGVVSLGGAQLYTGGTTVNAGVLRIVGDGALPTTGGWVVAGGLLDLAGNLSQSTSAVTLGSAFAPSTPGMHIGAGLTLTLGGNVNYVGAADLGAVISGSGTLHGGAGGRTVSVADNAGVADDLTISARLAGANWSKTGAGTLYLAGQNAITGTFTLSAGALAVGNDSALGTAVLRVGGSSTLRGDGLERTIANNVSLSSNVSLTIGGASNLHLLGTISASSGSATLVVNNSALTTLSQIVVAGGTTSQTMNLGGSGSVVVNKIIDNATSTAVGNLVLNGSGTIALNGANTYAGNTTIRNGTVLIGNAAALGASTAAVTVVSVTSGAAPRILTNDAVTIARDFNVLSGTGAGPIFGGATAVTSTFSGNISFSQAIGFTAVAGGTVYFNGTLDDRGATPLGINILGDGTIILNGSNLYTGLTTVSSGTLVANSQLAGQVVVLEGAVFTGSGSSSANFEVSGGTTNINDVQSGMLNVSAGTVNLGSGAAATGGVNVSGGTVVVATGAQILNSDPTNVTGGLLDVNGSIAGVVNVADGGSLKGSGTIGGLTIGEGGTFAPGNSVGNLTVNGGDVAGGASLQINGGANVVFEFRNAVGNLPGADWDRVDLGNGLLDLSGASPANRITLNIDSWKFDNSGHGGGWGDANFNQFRFDLQPVTAYEWLFIETGNLANLVGATPETINNYFQIIDDAVDAGVFGTGNPYARPLDENGHEARFKLAWKDGLQGTGLYITFTAVPEPGGIVLAGLASLGAGWYGRRRMKRAVK